MPSSKARSVGMALLVLLLVYVAVTQLPILRWVIEGAKAVHGLGGAGPVLTCLAIYLLTLALVPLVPLIVAAGWLHGVWGAVPCLIAATASAATSYSIARRFGASAAAQALLDHPKARALSELAGEGGILTVALVRLSPLLPYTPSNAVMGLTPLSLRDVALGTAFGMAPGTALYCWAGSLLPSAEAIEQGAAVRGGVFWALLAAAFAAATILGTAAARRLRKI